MIPGIVAGGPVAGGELPANATDFSEYPTGSEPADWTARWVTSGVTYSVESVEGANVLRAVVTSSGRHAISWDDTDGSNDIEILAKVRYEAPLSTNEVGPRAVVRGSGSAASETGYAAQLRETPDRDELQKVVSGTFSFLGSASMTMVSGAWYWIRLRAQGTSIKEKAWPDGSPEPGGWGTEVTDASIASGWCGFGAQVANTYYCGFFSYNDEGGAAPGP